MNKSDLNKRETPGSLSSSASFAVGQRPWWSNPRHLVHQRSLQKVLHQLHWERWCQWIRSPRPGADNTTPSNSFVIYVYSGLFGAERGLYIRETRTYVDWAMTMLCAVLVSWCWTGMSSLRSTSKSTECCSGGADSQRFNSKVPGLSFVEKFLVVFCLTLSPYCCSHWRISSNCFLDKQPDKGFGNFARSQKFISASPKVGFASSLR